MPPADPKAPSPPPRARRRTERHQWSVLFVLLVLIVGQGWVAMTLGIQPWWLLPIAAAVLAIGSWAAVLVPGRNRRVDRILGLVLVGVLVLGSVASTLVFVARVFLHSPLSPGELVATGAALWSMGIGVFGMVFWEIDGGGPVERSAGDPGWQDFMFSQQQPGVDSSWSPTFGDYVYTSLTNATAFSPTDTMPMSLRAKAAIGVQSVMSAAILIVLVARAVNIAR